MFGRRKLETLTIWLFDGDYVIDVLKMIGELKDMHESDHPAQVGQYKGAWFIRITLSKDNASKLKEWFRNHYNPDMGWFRIAR